MSEMQTQTPEILNAMTIGQISIRQTDNSDKTVKDTMYTEPWNDKWAKTHIFLSMNPNHTPR
jgi:hypothetical protein